MEDAEQDPRLAGNGDYFGELCGRSRYRNSVVGRAFHHGVCCSISANCSTIRDRRTIVGSRIYRQSSKIRGHQGCTDIGTRVANCLSRGGNAGRQCSPVVRRVLVDAVEDRVYVTCALRVVCLAKLPGGVNSDKHNGQKYSQDSDNDQKFNEGKSLPAGRQTRSFSFGQCHIYSSVHPPIQPCQVPRFTPYQRSSTAWT